MIRWRRVCKKGLGLSTGASLLARDADRSGAISKHIARRIKELRPPTIEEAAASSAACGQPMAKASSAWKSASTLISTTCGWHLRIPERLARWIGEVEGDLRLGGDFCARFFTSGWEGAGRVETCEPPSGCCC